MCGIVGYWSHGLADKNLALNMASKIASRGPDDSGAWLGDDGSLALAHRRLAIIDLSPTGHQPMVSECGMYSLVYNGEIYNHEDLRSELESAFVSIQWRGRSDTEVLLIALQCWGVEQTLAKLNGMFAFAFWDGKQKALFLARDRIGEKPLYFGRHNDVFLFGSELKVLTAHPKFSRDIDRDSLALFMRHNYIPAPYSIYLNTHKLMPSHYIVVTGSGRNISEQHCYWDLKDLAEQGLKNQIIDESSAIEQLDGLLKDSVKRRMVADVPLGAFLSGGYDSTTVAALMQVQSVKPVKTFSIGFKEDAFNEARYAKQVASHLGTDHTELYIGHQQALDVIPKLPEIYDEPFSDPSQVPTFLVSQLAKQHVTVALSGDGGDELFCGYSRYFIQKNTWRFVRNVPISMRPLIAFFLNNFPGSVADELMKIVPKKYRISNVSDRLPKLAEWVNNKSFEQFYRHSVSHSKASDQIILNAGVCTTKFESLAGHLSVFNDQEKMMLLDSLTYLPCDILTKVDRASMAVSLEARVPLLDHRLVEFAWRLPIAMKTKNRQGKWPLRQVLYKYVPKEIMERPKQGFSVPIEDWLTGPLRGWAEELLDERKLHEEGFFDPAPIREMWSEHILGKRRWHYYLWNVLMFQAWLRNH
jgi:asparagine synthase (glutamine-hydrolysing)